MAIPNRIQKTFSKLDIGSIHSCAEAVKKLGVFGLAVRFC
jgi:hypothetical protein